MSGNTPTGYRSRPTGRLLLLRILMPLQGYRGIQKPYRATGYRQRGAFHGIQGREQAENRPPKKLCFFRGEGLTSTPRLQYPDCTLELCPKFSVFSMFQCISSLGKRETGEH